jgi:hypothetical protein
MKGTTMTPQSENNAPVGGIWLPRPDSWLEMFGMNSKESSFLKVVTKSPTATLSEISDLASAMGLTVKLQVEKKPEPKAEA